MTEKERKVVAIVEENEKILVQKNEEGLFIPQIKVDGNETDEQALQRKIKEQSGIQIRVHSLLAESEDTSYYLCSPELPGQTLISTRSDSQPVFVHRLNASLLSGSKPTELPPGVILHLTAAK